MKLNFETRSGLQRCLNVQLSVESFKQMVVEQLQDKNLETGDSARSEDIIRALEQQFDVTVRQQVLQAVMNTSFAQALAESKSDIAGTAVFNVVEAVADNGFSYNAVFEVYPTITLPDLQSYKFTQLVAQVNEGDIERALLMLRRQQEKWCPVERTSQIGDSVIINYHAQAGERVLDGKSMRIELNGNSDSAVEGFEKGLVGVSTGDKLQLDINFPQDHYQADVAGRTVPFDVEVVRIEAQVLPELDADFIISLGIQDGGVEKLRYNVQFNMNIHLQKTIRLKNTLTILADILKDNPVEVPQALLQEEVTRLTCDPCEEVEGVDSFKHDLDPAMFTGLAHKRVARSLMTAELAKAKGIELDTEEVRTRLEELIEEYPDKERITAWFYEDRVRMAGIESDVLGDQVADWILENFQVEKVSTSYSEMMNLTDSK